MAVVYNMLLAGLELSVAVSSVRIEAAGKEDTVCFEILYLVDRGAQARQPHDALALDTEDEEVLPRKHSLTEPLGLALLSHLRCAGEEGIFTDAPGLMSVDV
jgi:hypothetical protein